MLVTHGSHFQAVSSELEKLSQDQILHPSTLLSLSGTLYSHATVVKLYMYFSLGINGPERYLTISCLI